MKAVDDLEDEDAPQFSDDEEEQAYLASLKNKKSNGNANKSKEASSETPIKRKRGKKIAFILHESFYNCARNINIIILKIIFRQ